MNIKLSEWNRKFIKDVKRKTLLPETTIVNNIICYYRAMKTVHGQNDIENALVEFGKSSKGLMVDDDLQLYLMLVFEKPEIHEKRKGDMTFKTFLKRDKDGEAEIR